MIRRKGLKIKEKYKAKIIDKYSSFVKMKMKKQKRTIQKMIKKGK